MMQRQRNIWKTNADDFCFLSKNLFIYLFMCFLGKMHFWPVTSLDKMKLKCPFNSCLSTKRAKTSYIHIPDLISLTSSISLIHLSMPSKDHLFVMSYTSRIPWGERRLHMTTKRGLWAQTSQHTCFVGAAASTEVSFLPEHRGNKSERWCRTSPDLRCPWRWKERQNFIINF